MNRERIETICQKLHSEKNENDQNYDLQRSIKIIRNYFH